MRVFSPLGRGANLRSLAKFMLRALSLVLVGLVIFSLPKQSLAWLNPPFDLPTSQSSLAWPDISVDSSGVAHAVWMYSGSGDFARGSVFYMRGALNATGDAIAWEATSKQQIGGSDLCSPTRSPKIVADDNGTVHILFGTTSGVIYYDRNTSRGLPGAWVEEVVADPGTNAYNPALAVDRNGTPVAVWGEGLGDGNSRLVVTYRTGAGSWYPRLQMSESSYLVRKPTLTVRGAGATAQVHAVYEYKVREKDSKFVTGYARGGINGPFGFENFSSRWGLEGDTPAITSDPVYGTLFAGFIFGNLTNGYKLGFAYSFDGENWAGLGQISPAGLWPSNPSFSAANNRAYIITEEKHWTGSKFDSWLIYSQIYDANTTAYLPAEQISGSGKSTGPHGSVGGRGQAVIWNLNGTSTLRYNVNPGGRDGVVVPTATAVPGQPTAVPGQPTATTVPPTSTPAPVVAKPEGQLQLFGQQNRATVKSGGQITAKIITAGGATQYQLSNNESALTDPDTVFPLPGYKPISGTSEVSWSGLSATGSECVQKKVYARLLNAQNTPSNVVQASIWVDPGVAATVNAINPAYGDPAFTKTPYYFLLVKALDSECSGLNEIQLGEPLGTAATNLAANLAATAMPVPLLSQQTGLHKISLNLTDNVGNKQAYETSITYDPYSPAFTGTAKLDVIPKTTTSAAPAVITAKANKVDLKFTDMIITDTIYSSNGQQFWGMNLANSRTAIAVTDTTKLSKLSWQALAVKSTPSKTNAYNFTVSDYCLFDGLATTGAGDYYVYAQVLDGAGNSSTRTIASDKVTLSSDFVDNCKVRVFLPIIKR